MKVAHDFIYFILFIHFQCESCGRVFKTVQNMMDHLARVRCVQARLPKRERRRAAVEVDDQEGFPQPRKKKETRLYCDREPCKTRKSQENLLNL